MPAYDIEFNKNNSVSYDILRYDNAAHKGDFIEDSDGYEFVVLKVIHKIFSNTTLIVSNEYETD